MSKIILNSGSWYQHLIKRRPVVEISCVPIKEFKVTNLFYDIRPKIWVENLDGLHAAITLRVENIDGIIPNIRGFTVENIDQELSVPNFFVSKQDNIEPPLGFSVEIL